MKFVLQPEQNNAYENVVAFACHKQERIYSTYQVDLFENESYVVIIEKHIYPIYHRHVETINGKTYK